MSEHSLNGKTVALQETIVTLNERLSFSIKYVYYSGKSDKNKKFLIRYFDASKINDYEAERRSDSRIPDHPNKLKQISAHSTPDEAFIFYEYPKKLNFSRWKENILSDSKALLKFLSDLFNIINEIHNFSLIYNEINPDNLFFDENFNLKLAGFCDVTDFSFLKSLNQENFEVLTGRYNFKSDQMKNYCFLGSCIDMLNIGRFLKTLGLHCNPCKKCSRQCKTKTFFTHLLQILTHQNPTLRGTYEDVIEILKIKNLCKSKILSFKSNPSSSVLRSLLPKMLIENSQNFNLTLLNSLLFELNKNPEFYQIFSNYISEVSNSVTITYKQSFQLLISVYFIHINFKYSAGTNQTPGNFIERIAELWFDHSICNVSSKAHSISVLSTFYLVVQFQMMLFPSGNERGKWKSLSTVTQEINYLKSYHKRINEFLELFFLNNECLFGLKDLVIVMTSHEIHCILNFVKNKGGAYLNEEIRVQLDRSCSLLQSYQLYLKLMIIKNAEFQRRPAIFFVSNLTELTAKNHSLFLASGRNEQTGLKNYQKEDTKIKELTLDSESQMKSFLREMNLMMHYFHPQILPLLGTDNSIENLNLVFPDLKGGSLSDLLHKKKNTFISDDQKLSILIDISKALEYLHSQDVIYRDLNTANIYLEYEIKNSNDPVFIRLSNFSNARQVSRFMTNLVNNSKWASPEVLAGENYDCKSDVFSFAITAWEIVTRLLPDVKEKTTEELRRDILCGFRPDINKVKFGKNNEKICEIIEKCWDCDKLNRPSFSDVLKGLTDMIS